MSDQRDIVHDPARLAAVRRAELLDTPPEEVFDRLTRLAAKIVGAPASFISIVDETRDFYKSCVGFAEPLASNRQIEGTTFCHFALPAREPLVINDTRADPEYRNVPTVESLGVAAYLGIPLVTSDGQAIGSFCTIDVKPRQWREEDIEVLRELAASAMREIELRQEVRERERIEAELRRQSRIAALGDEVGDAVIRGGTSHAVLQRCAEALVGHLEVAFARIWVVDESGDYLLLRASAGLYRQLDGAHARVPMGAFKIGLIAAERRPYLTNDMLHDERIADKEWARREGMAAFAGYPLVVEERAVGVVAMFARQPLAEADLTALRAVADRLALFVDRARTERERAEALERAERARAEAERRAVEEEALRRAAEAVTSTFTVDETSRRIAESALAATRADGAFVETIDLPNDELCVTAVAGDQAPRVGARGPFRGSFAEYVVQQMQPLFIPRLGDAERPLPPGLVERCRDCSALVVPLLDSGEPVGALILVRRGDHPRFTPDEAERALTFGNLAALAYRKIHLLEDAQRRREELERVTESRARLIRGFSHDLKNPLGAADGHAQLLAEGILGELTARQRDSTMRIRRTIREALNLIDDLVELGRAEASEIEVELAPTDVREVAREMVDLHRPQAENLRLTMVAELPPTFPVTLSDPSRTRQILGNLISNAVKYTPPGGHVIVRVALRSRAGIDGASWVAVDVEDTGPGIPPEKQHLLFQEFSRIEPGDKPGAGLGLAISQRVARALGGEISLDSAPGTGARFTLWLPLRDRELEPVLEPAGALAEPHRGG